MILTFNLSGPATGSVAYMSSTFDPPSEIAGKLCYVESTFFTWDNGTTSMTTNDCIYVECDWAQPFSYGQYASGVATKSAAVAVWAGTAMGFASPGPVLCNIPEGGHTVTFKFTRYSGQSLTVVADNYVTLCLKIVPADSRQLPIGA